MKKTKFKNGQWIIVKWSHGDYDFAKFKKYFQENSFLSHEFYRFNTDWVFENLTSDLGDDCDLTDYRYAHDWRLATKEEIKKFTTLIKKLG